MMKFPRWQAFLPVLIIILMFILPIFLNSPRYLTILIQVFFNVILALGVYSVWMIGYINAAQPVFMGFGAYTIALLTIRAHWSFWLTLPVAGIIPAVIAALFGWVGLKLKGTYFLFLTIAFCLIIIWGWTFWQNLFGGQIGIFNVPDPSLRIFGLTVNFVTSMKPYYYLALILCTITCMFYFRIHGSRLGRVWEGVGKNPDLLATTGISIFTQRLIVLAISCFFAGLAGAAYAPYISVVSPSQFTLFQGIWIVLGALVGGIFTPVGAIIGIVFMAILNVLLIQYSVYVPLILGIILIFVLLFMPTGLYGLPERIRNKIKELTGHKVSPPETKKDDVKLA